jgi:hypothetical protein
MDRSSEEIEWSEEERRQGLIGSGKSLWHDGCIEVCHTERLVVEISKIWRLLPRDLIFTGTPSGVGPLRVGDGVEIESPTLGSFSWEIV